MPAITRQRVDIFYEDVGKGRPVLFVHGWGTSHELWDRQVYAFAPRYRCVAVDLRGHGASSKPAAGYAYDDHVADLAALLDHLQLDNVSVVGSSFGGSVSVVLANECRSLIRQVVAVGSPPRIVAADDYPPGRRQAEAVKLLDDLQRDREGTMRQVVDDSVNVNVGEPMLSWLFGLALRMPTWAALETYRGVLASDIRPVLAELQQPVLVVQGRHDRFVSAEAAKWMAGATANARLEILEASGHLPFLEEPAAFNSLLGQLLAEAD